MRKIFKYSLSIAAIILTGSLVGCGSSGGGSNGGGIAGLGGNVCAGAECVDLGTAGNYAILAKTGVATVPSSVVTGNVAVSPESRGFLTGWDLISEPTDNYFTSAQVVAPGRLFAADNLGATPVLLNTAVLNMETAYEDAKARTATSAATTNVEEGTLTSLTLAPGVYEKGVKSALGSC